MLPLKLYFSMLFKSPSVYLPFSLGLLEEIFSILISMLKLLSLTMSYPSPFLGRSSLSRFQLWCLFLWKDGQLNGEEDRRWVWPGALYSVLLQYQISTSPVIITKMNVTLHFLIRNEQNTHSTVSFSTVPFLLCNHYFPISISFLLFSDIQGEI